MKKIKKGLMLMIAFVVLCVVGAFAQMPTDTIGGSGGTGTGGNSIFDLFGNPATLAMLTTIVTGWLTKNVTWVAAAKQWLSWIVAILLAFIGYWKGVGMFATTDVVNTMAIGAGVAMLTNHLYDAGTLDSLLSLFFAKKKTV